MAGDLRKEEKAIPSFEEEGSYLRRTQGHSRRSLVGQTLGNRYRVVDFIARGGMGTVYVAEQLGLRRKVALKVLDVRPSDEGAESQEFRARFEKEASLAASIAHPNVVVVHDFGQTDEELCYLAMEYLEGRTVQHTVEDSGPLAVGRIVHIALQACAALGAAHAAGLIHRDLKPSNLILLERGQDADFVKLVDFGLVKQVVARGEDPKPIGVVTKPGTLLGSPAFISPEQILANAVTPATDLYSLGAVMFFMATGVPPFRGRSEYEIIRAHVEREPPALRDVAPASDVPAELESIIRRCLAKKTHERFANVQDLAAALESCESITLPDLGPRRLIPTSSQPPASTPRPPARSATPTPRKATPKTRSPVPTLDTRSLGPSERKRLGRVWLTVPLIAIGIGVLLAAVGQSGWNSRSAQGDPPMEEPVVPVEPSTGAKARPPSSPTADTGALRVTTHPPGALVRYQGLVLGQTPLDLSLNPHDAPWTLDFELEGHAPRRLRVNRDAEDIDVSLIPSSSASATAASGDGVTSAATRPPRVRTQTHGRVRPTPRLSEQSGESATLPSVPAVAGAEWSTRRPGGTPPETSLRDGQSPAEPTQTRSRSPETRSTDNLDPWNR